MFQIVVIILIAEGELLVSAAAATTSTSPSVNDDGAKPVNATCDVVLGDICSEQCDGHLPSKLPKCPQCWDLGCGAQSSLISTGCFCDAECLYYRDCCADFETECPSDYLQAKEMMSNQISSIQPSCVDLSSFGEMEKYKLVNSCAANLCKVETNVSDLSHYPIPVTDLDTGLHYVTYDCARCNNATNITGWNLEFICDINYHAHNITAEDISRWLADGRCNIDLIKPFGLRICDKSLVETCHSCNNKVLVEACMSSPTQHVISDFETQYRNPFCAACDSVPEENISCVELSIQIPGFDYEFDYMSSGPSLTILFDFRGTNSRAQNVVKTQFECYYPYQMLNETCVEPFCPIGYLERDECAHFDMIQLPVNISLTINKTNTVSNVSLAQTLIYEDIYDDIDFYLLDVTRNYSLFNEERFMHMFNCTNTSYQSNRQVNSYQWTCSIKYEYMLVAKWTRVINTDLESVNHHENWIKTLLVAHFHQLILDHAQRLNLDIMELQTISPVGLFHYPPNPNDTLPTPPTFVQSTWNHTALSTSCQSLAYTEDKYVISNDTLLISDFYKPVPSGMFSIRNGTAYICREFYEANIRKEGWLIHGSLPLVITSQVALSLSVASLLLRCVLQIFVPVYWTFPNKLQFLLCLSMCITFLLCLFIPYTSSHPKICYSFALLLHWSFLATFACKLCIAINMFKTFRASNIKKSDTNSSRLLYYLLLCWGCPCVVVAIPVGLDYSSIDDIYKAGYSYTSCWITNQIAHIVYFGVPLGVLLIAIIIIFILISISLRQMIQKANAAKKRSSSYEFWINVRLACVLGITWITAFLASVINNPVVWYIFVILCGLQGVFIVISFVFTKRVWQSLSKNVKEQMSRSGSRTSKTSSSTLKSSRTASSRSNKA